MTVLYFAWVREKVGIPAEQLELPADVQSVEDLAGYLRKRNESFSNAFSDTRGLRVALNQEHVSWDAPVAANDEVAFFPPVTGG